MTLIHMLPMEISAYISMHESNAEYRTFDALKRFVYKYVRTLRLLKRTGPRAAHLFDDAPPPLEVEEPEPDEEALMERLPATDDVEEQVAVRFPPAHARPGRTSSLCAPRWSSGPHWPSGPLWRAAAAEQNQHYMHQLQPQRTHRKRVPAAKSRSERSQVLLVRQDWTYCARLSNKESTTQGH